MVRHSLTYCKALQRIRTDQMTSDDRPLERLDDWDDFVQARYAPPPSPAATEKPKEQFRDYAKLARPGVREFYRLNHTRQTRDFVLSKKRGYLALDKRRM